MFSNCSLFTLGQQLRIAVCQHQRFATHSEKYPLKRHTGAFTSKKIFTLHHNGFSVAKCVDISEMIYKNILLLDMVCSQEINTETLWEDALEFFFGNSQPCFVYVMHEFFHYVLGLYSSMLIMIKCMFISICSKFKLN